MKWTSRWPTKPGWYWLYGKRFSDDIIQLNPVEVVLAKTGPVYITRGSFLYRTEGAIGFWVKMILPKLPDIQGIKI